MQRTVPATRVLFGAHFEKESWTALGVVQKYVYMSRVEFSEVMVRHYLGRFLAEHKLNHRSPSYKLHIVMAPEVLKDESFKTQVAQIMDAIGVSATFRETCNRGASSYAKGGQRASTVELIAYCDIEVTART